MQKQISRESISHVLQDILMKNNIISESDTAVIFYDLDLLASGVNLLKSIFPKQSNHAIAFKANPIIEILKLFKDLGVGIETASLPELYMAQKIGFQAKKIIFDSPSKTIEDLRYALKLGVHINVDSFGELSRINSLLDGQQSKSNIGIRINPQTGNGSIKSTSVADKISKFGIPINSNRENIITAYEQNKWLNGIHLHTGSQGVSQKQLLDGIQIVYSLTEEINARLKKQGREIEYFDMGGGYPVNYKYNTGLPGIESFVEKMKCKFPKLFSEEVNLITEYGRFISANAAWAISRVEYVKQEPDYKILSTHLGADFLLREAYNPEDWEHEITTVDKQGLLKSMTDYEKYIIAGPLCFAGDIIAKDIKLPKVDVGDYIVIHDVGAYTLSMWSRYNSRQMPLVVGYSMNNGSYKILKKRETLEDLYDFWSR